MAKFCTGCGSRNDDGAGFCEECGKPLRAGATAPAAPSPGPRAPDPLVLSASAPALRRWLLPAVLGTAVLIIAIGGIAWWVSPPAASAEAFASALKGPSGASATPSTDLLCLANLPYDRPHIDVQPYDVNSRRWMDALASAGLYAPGRPAEGLFQRVIQYTPTEELGKWRQGARLCLAKSWSVSEVKGGPFAPEKRGQHTLYRASVVWKADGAAPWVSRVPAGPWIPAIRVADGALTTQSSHVFEVRERRWVVLTPADFVQIQRDLRPGPGGARSNAAKTDQGSVFAPLTNMFSGFGAAHPLVGEWALDQSTPEAAMASAVFAGMAGGPLPGGRITFGNDYMQAGSERVKTHFETNGNVVSVRPEGETDAIQFRVEGKNKMFMNVGPVEIPFNRTR
jgi:hypothetical protein